MPVISVKLREFDNEVIMNSMNGNNMEHQITEKIFIGMYGSYESREIMKTYDATHID
jgi:hypothetical protein